MTKRIRTTVKRAPNKKDINALSHKQRLFVAEMQADPAMSISLAAEKAGYKNPDSAGARLMKNDIIARAVSAAINKRVEKAEVKADEIDRFLLDALNFDPIHIFENGPDGSSLTLKELKEMAEGSRRSITKIRVKNWKGGREGATEESTDLQVEWMDKKEIAKLLYARVGALEPENPAVNVQVNMVAQLRDALGAKRSSLVVSSEDIDKLAEEG